MPSIDDLLDAEATRWRADVDSRCEAATFTMGPPGRRPSRRLAWGGAALGAAAAATAIALAVSNNPAGHRSSGGGGASASCAAPTLSLRDANGPRHFRPVLTLGHPVRPGDPVPVYGYFFVTTCNDSGQDAPNLPARSVRLVLRTADGQRRVIFVAHPHGDLGTFHDRVRIPADAAPGPARISFGHRYGSVFFTVTGN